MLSWSAPVSDGGSPILGYQVWLRVGEGDPWSLVTWDTGSSAPGYTVAGLVAGTGYQFAVRANNAVGESAGFISSDPGIVPLPGVATVPGAPVGPLVGTPGVNQVVLSWSAPVSDGGSPILGYQVWLRVGEGDPWSLVTWDTGSSAPGYTVAGLVAGTGYQFAVRANNAVGESAGFISSDPGIVPLPGVATVPGAPVGPLVGTPGVNQVVLSWSAPVSDGGSPILGYQVWLRVGEGDPWSLVTWDTGSSAPGYTVAGLVAGTGYQFAVRANNAVGESAGFISSDPGIVPLPGVATVPGAPVGPLVGTPGVNQVVLSWSAPVSDGGSPILGYQVWLRVGEGDPWSLVTWDTGSSAPGYTVAGLVAGTGYQFAVRANNAVGESAGFISSDPGIVPL